MRKHTKVEQYFQVHLDKHIPIQGASGSGNAATAMYAFNQLCNHPGTNKYTYSSFL